MLMFRSRIVLTAFFLILTFAAAAADVEVETVSGRITVHVAEGVRARSVTGPLPAALDRHGTDCTIATRAVSGRVSVTSR